MKNKILLNFLEEKKFKEIHEITSNYNPVDLAYLLAELDAKDLAVVFRIIEKEKAAEVFSYMDNDFRQSLLNTFSGQEIKDIIDYMFADDVVDFLEDMPVNVVSKLLDNVDDATRENLNTLLQYSEDSVGSVMTIEFVELYSNMTVNESLEKIRTIGIHSETVYTCYVVEKHKLIGIITAKDLLTNPGQTKIQDLMSDNFISVKTTDDKEYAAKLFRKYDLIAIPVLDSENLIVGIVTFDDAIDVLIDESTEDMYKMAAISINSESYLKTSAFKHAQKRIAWLLILMLSATITGSIITNYEDAFAMVPLLVSFIPMLMDTGGNCGSQSSTLIIRGLAVDELHFSDFFKIMWKEFRVSLIVSVALAVINGIRILLFYNSIELALVVSIALIATVIISKLVGCALPIIAGKCRLDPAIMAAPLITTIVDTFSIMIYFKIATVVFAL